MLVFLLIPGSIAAMNFGNDIFMTAGNLIAGFEGFSPRPYWDNKQWSWGYGTKAPGPDGIIDEATAMQQLNQHVKQDYNYLLPLLTRPLSDNQWAALLSFAYNEGPGNADNLVPNINSYNDAALQTQWLKYIYAGGVVNDALVERREKEWQIWSA